MEQQTRTYRWADPHEMHKRGRALSGLEFMRLLASDDLGRTPMMATLAYTFVAVDEGYVESECRPGPAPRSRHRRLPAVPDRFLSHPVAEPTG